MSAEDVRGELERLAAGPETGLPFPNRRFGANRKKRGDRTTNISVWVTPTQAAYLNKGASEEGISRAALVEGLISEAIHARAAAALARSGE